MLEWLCTHYQMAIGLFGDGATFAGGIVLGMDALKKEKEFKEIKTIVSTRQAAPLAKLKIDMDGRIVWTEDDVTLVFMHRATRKALWGCALLVMGFAALFAARLIEMWK